MLGVFKKRWKPKRVASDSIRPAVTESASPEPPTECFVRPVPLRHVYPMPVESPNNTCQSYDSTWRKGEKASRDDNFNKNTNQSKSEVSNHYEHYGTNRSEYSTYERDYYGNRGGYPMAPNICVEGGRIEFVKPSTDGMMGIVSPPSSPIGARSLRKHYSCEEEKYDGDKEALEARIRQLEQRLEAESISAQKDRLAVAKLQQQLSKRSSGVPRDVDRTRPDSGGRITRVEQDADRTNTRLRAAQKEIARMEETIRTLLQYKSVAETLKQEKASLSATLEARTIHYQTTLTKLTVENDSLRSQIASLEAINKQFNEKELKSSETKQDIVKDCDTEKESESQKRQYEKCLDDVANQVVRAILSQKGLREELTRLSARARELEAQNRTLGALLLRQLRPRAAPSPASPDPALDLPIENVACHCNAGLLTNQKLNSEILPLSHKSKCKTQLLTKKCLHKNNRLCKSNEDINSLNDKQYADNKRFSDGNIITTSCSDKLFTGNSIFSFKDDPLDDSMSVCVTQNTYKLSADDKRRHQILSELWTELKGIEVTPQSLLQALRAVDPSLWASPKRPLTLNLKVTQPVMLSECLHRLSQTIPEDLPPQTTEDEVTVESPESGNRDEGYSTMSSDVQVDPCRQGENSRELEDLKEATDETDNQVLVNINNAIIVEDKSDQEILYIPLNVALSFNPRNSFPPTKDLNPFQHVMRSFSDSNLCLKFTTSASQRGENYVTFSSPSSPSMILLDVVPIIQRDRKSHPLRRTKGASSLISTPAGISENADNTSQSRSSWVSNIDEQVDNCQYDADYVQHWLQLDDTRSALQQQHRDLLELEYDQAEMEDWSLNLSCEDLQDPQWKRSNLDAATPGQISLSTLPSIQENNALELEEDVSECLWNNSSYMMDNTSDKFPPLSLDHDMECERKDDGLWPYPPMENSGLPSPGGSWSSIDNSEDFCANNECYYTNKHVVENDLSKRSSCYTDEPESSTIDTDFTRDFYRLVKYESTKSLASNSSRGLGAGGGSECPGPILKLPDVQITLKQEREQSLQNVLNFIAEQQKYCHSREEQDSLPSRPISEIRELPPPYIDCQEFNMVEALDETKNTEASFRNSYGSEITYSENDSCDIVLSNDYSSLYREISPDLTKVPRIIDNNQTSEYSDSEGYRNYNEIENEIDEQHLLKVHQKNEINKYVILENSSDRACNPNKEISITSSEQKQTTSSQIECHSLLEDEKSNSKNAGINGEMLEPSLLDEILNACCKRVNATLVPVPEEEETVMDNSLTQTSDSLTTSASTSDTVATEICKNKKKSTTDKSKIPVPSTSALKKSSFPNKTKSKLPLPSSFKKTTFVNPSTDSSVPSTSKLAPGSIIISQGSSHSRMLSFHESATSKEVIDELNRMIRKGEEGAVTSDNEVPPVTTSHLDKTLWCPTGWVHVERDIDFSDPKARANLLDVMLASSDSSPSPTSSCAGSCSSDSEDKIADYSKLHRLHKYRRQKKAAALRERGLAVLRFSYFHRPTIIGRNDFYFRYGKQEREAVACFDFLEEMSSSTNLLTSIEDSNTISCVENQISQDSGKVSQKSSDTLNTKNKDSDHSSHETFSDSCALSYSGSDISFEENQS